MKNPILEKHFSNIRDQLKLVLNTEKIHDSTNPIQLLYDNVLLIRNNGRVITDEDFTYRLELALADTYKTLSLRIDSLLQNAKTLAFSYFKEKLDIKEWRDDLYADAVEILNEKYADKLMQIRFYLYSLSDDRNVKWRFTQYFFTKITWSNSIKISFIYE